MSAGTHSLSTSRVAGSNPEKPEDEKEEGPLPKSMGEGNATSLFEAALITTVVTTRAPSRGAGKDRMLQCAASADSRLGVPWHGRGTDITGGGGRG